MHKSVKMFSCAFILVTGSAISALSADMTMPPRYYQPVPQTMPNAGPQSAPPAFYAPSQQPQASHRIFPYVRGDLGLAKYRDIEDFTGVSAKEITIENLGYNFGIGAGAAITQNFRVDATGEYRMVDEIKTTCSTTKCRTQEHTAIVGFINGYYDIGNYSGLTPYIGAGIGFASHEVDNVKNQDGNAFDIDDGTSNSLAWNAQIGASYDISRNLTFDANYRYTNLGDVKYSVLGENDDGETVSSQVTLENMDAHDFRIGLRYYFD